VAISERDSFASLGMTHGRLFVGHDTSKEMEFGDQQEKGGELRERQEIFQE